MQVFTFNEGASGNNLLIYIHGGAYINNPNSSHLTFLNRLSEDMDMEVLLPIYPKLPVYNCEYAFEKMLSFYSSAADKYKDKTIILAGDSAGGGFALALASEIKNMDVQQPERLILLSPWIDLSMENEEMISFEKADPMLGIYGLKEMGAIWADDLDINDPRVSPINADLSGLCPIDLYVGTREIFYPEIIRLDSVLDQYGTEHTLTIGQGMNHVYPVYPIPEAERAISQIEESMEKCLKENFQ